MSKSFLRVACALLCLLLCLPVLSSCGNENVYELGPYSINKEEYAYLLSSYKRTAIDELGIEESHLDYVADSSTGTTYGEYIEKMYRQEFEQSVYVLLFSLALFDEYGLSLSEEQKQSIKSAATSVIYYYGNGSISKFNNLAGEYGFSDDAIYSIYEKQAKQSAVVSHIFGKDYVNITDEDKEDYYQENFLHFQVLVVNTLYRKNDDGTYSNLSESERKAMLELENEVLELFVRENLNFEYRILPALLGTDDMSTVTYEELWANPKINDDSLYPNGYYMLKPTATQMMSPNTISQAMLTLVGDVSPVAAKRYFDGNGTIKTENGTEEVKKGDYFTYGTAFIKRLEIDDGAWKNEANKDFFTEDFVKKSAQYSLFNLLQEFEKTSPYTLMTDSNEISKISFVNVPANYLDYDYLHGTEE